RVEFLTAPGADFNHVDASNRHGFFRGTFITSESFFARIKDILDDKTEFAAGIVRRNSPDEFAGCLPIVKSPCL
ncbi:MAG: hypothetical protein IKP64_13875, partial [Selenomonadaceae bacterium]|nr:hypothetical protein [Selenomonadaceae bacterium]